MGGGKRGGTVDLARGLNAEQRRNFSKDVDGLKVRYDLASKQGVIKRGSTGGGGEEESS